VDLANVLHKHNNMEYVRGNIVYGLM
jgi:hypothetical protein